MSAHDDIKTQLAAYEAENTKFEKGNSAAGTRARKALAELAKAVKARRNEITETKNERLKEKAGSIKDHHDKVVPEKKAK
jgi:hypothetical protein